METKKIGLVCMLFLLATMTTSVYVKPANAQGGNHWITGYTVTDTQTQEILVKADFTVSEDVTVINPIISGEQLTVQFTVNILVGGSGTLKLSSYMQKPSSGPYWELIPGDYDLGAGYTPNLSSMSFNWKQGAFEMICYGQALKVSQTKFNSTLVQLSGETGDILDAIKVNILTAGGGEFQSLYDQKEAKLQSMIDSGVAAGYTDMYSDMLNQSKALANKGYVPEAVALLNALPNSGEPMGSAVEMILYPLIAVAAIAAVLFAVMFMRARGRNSYFKMVVEDQIKDLEGLTLRASKIDRTMSSSLDSVKDRLKRLVGM